jgi:hypothetical protein
MKKCILILTLLIVFSSLAYANVVYIDDNPNGVSWNKYQDCYKSASEGNDFNSDYCFMENGNLKFKDGFYEDLEYTSENDDVNCNNFELQNFPFKNYLDKTYNYETEEYEYEFNSGLHKHLDFVYDKYGCAPENKPVLIYDPDDYESEELYYVHAEPSYRFYNLPYYKYDDVHDYYGDKYWYQDYDYDEIEHYEKYWHKTKDLKKFKYYKKGYKTGYKNGYYDGGYNNYYNRDRYDFPYQKYKYNPKLKAYHAYY